jgi:hypothetical protein
LLTPGEAPAKSSGCGGPIGDRTPFEDHLGDQGGIVVGRYVATAGELVPASLRRQLVPVTRLVPEERAGRARRRAARAGPRDLPARAPPLTARWQAWPSRSPSSHPPSCRRGALCHARVSGGDRRGRRRNQRGWAEARRTLKVARRRSLAGRRRSRFCAPRGVVLAPRKQYSGG